MSDSTTDKRYQSQEKLPEIGKLGQKKIRAAKVLVVGAGGLGCTVLTNLIYAGIGTIGMVDDDLVRTQNLSRQILYDLNDVGKLKCSVSAAKLKDINPETNVIPYSDRLTSANAGDIIQPFDMVIDCSDNFAARYIQDDVCHDHKKALIFGGVRSFEGQVAVFNHKGGISFSQAFPDREKSLASENCEDSGVLVTLVNMVGAMQANEAIKIILGLSSNLTQAMWYVNMKENSTRVIHW